MGLVLLGHQCPGVLFRTYSGPGRFYQLCCAESGSILQACIAPALAHTPAIRRWFDVFWHRSADSGRQGFLHRNALHSKPCYKYNQYKRERTTISRTTYMRHVFSCEQKQAAIHPDNVWQCSREHVYEHVLELGLNAVARDALQRGHITVVAGVHAL